MLQTGEMGGCAVSSDTDRPISRGEGVPCVPYDTSQGRGRKPLTARQAAILEFIRNCIATKGRPPSIREIGRAFHICSTNGVNDHLWALEKKGRIVRDQMVARGIRLVGRG